MSVWLLTGGAGYIGAHVQRALTASGRDVVVFDDFSTGLERKVPMNVPVVQASVTDVDALVHAFTKYDVDGVVHLAAKKAVGESVEHPLYYYRQNVGGVMSLLEAMDIANVSSIVFSSSASVYGTPTDVPVTEDSATVPESPYGETKLIGEWLVKDAAQTRDLSWVSLRYFNVAGAGGDELGDTGVFNLIPMVFRALSRGERPQIFGTDYPTPDGTCIRDYIHVTDLAEAHVAAANFCESGSAQHTLNVGRGTGISVTEVMDVVSDVIGRDVNAEAAPRRPGDPPITVADPTRIETLLDWRAHKDLSDMVASAWSAWQAMRD